MQVVYIDVETTGLDPETCQVLEVGCLVDDLSRPFDPITWSTYVKHDVIRGQIDALAMHASWIHKCKDGIYPVQVCYSLSGFLAKHVTPGQCWLGGKNVAFDIAFLAKLPGFKLEGLRLTITDWKFRSRFVDPGMLFFKNGIPSLQEICDQNGILYQAHTVLGDCVATALAVMNGLCL